MWIIKVLKRKYIDLVKIQKIITKEPEYDIKQLYERLFRKKYFIQVETK